MRVLKFFCWLVLCAVCCLALMFSGTYLYLSPDLPSVESLKDTKLQIPLHIYSQDHKLIAEYGEMRREPLPFKKVPENFIHALLAAEDDNFLTHHGVDPASLLRAFYELATTGEIQTGGSTLTMQVAKNYLLSSERSFSRKATEILLALKIERTLAKDEILELYINKIYLGHHAYGIQAAALTYYGKPIGQLSIAQMATIAGLPKAPSRYNPLDDPKRSKVRRDWILGRMYQLGYIDKVQYQLALSEPLGAAYHYPTPEAQAPYVAEMAREEMIRRYGRDAYTGGYNVYLTVSSQLQNAARLAVQKGLLSYDHRHGYRGPEAKLPDQDPTQWQQRLSNTKPVGGLILAIVTQVEPQALQVMLANGGRVEVPWSTMQWARPYINPNAVGRKPQSPADVAKVGDLIRIQHHDGGYAFTQVPQVQGALVSLNPTDGAILALVGGFDDSSTSGFNRATQARRQTGSNFKPFIYAAALDKGYTPASIVNDAPLPMMYNEDPNAWHPKNDTGTFLGPITLRTALYRSRNLASVRVLSSIGMGYTIKYLQRFGFDREHLPRNLSLALGSASLTPMEMAAGWAIFANNGYRVQPYLIERIEDRDGKTLYEAKPKRAPTEEEHQQLKAEAEANTSNTAAPAPATQADASAPRVYYDGAGDTATAQVPALNPEDFAPQAIDPRTAYILTNMLQDVIKRGTGRRAQSLNRTDLAGKTGTTNDAKDSWFTGFNGRIVTTVWSGFDQPQSLGNREYGSTVSLPIWIDFMGKALAGTPPYLAPEPEGIVTLKTAQGYPELFKVGQSAPSQNPAESLPSGEGNGATPEDAAPSQDKDSAPSTMDLF